MLSGFFHLMRLARAGFVFAREGVLGLIDPVMLPPGVRLLVRIGRLFERRNAGSGSVRLAKALARLGPSYVKLGQLLATRPDVVGAVIANDLESLQDRMPPFSQRQAEAAIVEGLGKPVSELFTQFGPPVAAASSRNGASGWFGPAAGPSSASRSTSGPAIAPATTDAIAVGACASVAAGSTAACGGSAIWT